MQIRNKVLITAMIASVSSIAMATPYSPTLQNGVKIMPDYTQADAQMLANQGCDYAQYETMYNSWATNAERTLNNAMGTTAMNNYQKLAPTADINSCLSGPIGQLQSTANAFGKVIGVLNGDINMGNALNYASTAMTNQACSVVSNLANQQIQNSGANSVVNGLNNISNPGNAIGGQTGGLVNGMVNSMSQQSGDGSVMTPLGRMGGDTSGSGLMRY